MAHFRAPRFRVSAAAWMGLFLLVVRPDPAACLDHLKCYTARETSFPRFASRTVSLTDELGPTTATVVRPKRLCNPADKNGEGITDPTAHLMCYAIRDSGSFTSHPVLVQNQFGDQTMTVVKAESLCVPADKDNVPRVSNIDHFKCYRVRGGPFQTTVTVADQFETVSATLVNARLLCNPVDKNGEGVLDMDTHLACYTIKSGTPFTRQDVTVADQFAEQDLRSLRSQCRRRAFLCVPSRTPGQLPVPTTTSTTVVTTTTSSSTTSSTATSTTTTSSTTTSTLSTSSSSTTTSSLSSTTSPNTSTTSTSTTSTTSTTVCPCSTPQPSSIGSNFNGTAIQGRFIWFNSVLKATGLGSMPVTITFTNSTIEFTANGVDYNLSVPNAQVTFDPAATLATTTFNTVTNTWETVTPPGLAGNTFLDGLAFQVPVNFPGGINPVTWTGTFTASQSGVTINWQWAAAVYTTFSTDYNALGVKPVDDNMASIYLNSDHAGTPENFKAFVTGGARGGGGSNFTGSYSGTDSVSCACCDSAPRSGCQPPPPRGARLRIVRLPGGLELSWKWKNSAPVSKADFGNPSVSTSLALCLYEDTGGPPALRMTARIPADGVCANNLCWIDVPTGYRYRDRRLTPDGISNMLLKAGDVNRASIRARGKGENLHLPPFLSPPLLMQLQRVDDAHCWASTFSTSARNDGLRFVAQSD